MLLQGKKGLVLNIVNKNSIGWAIAEAAAEHGAEVGVGAQNERFLEGVQKLIEGRERMSSVMVDFQDDAQLEALAEKVRAQFGGIDFLVHSAAFAQREDLQGRFIDTSREGFRIALEVSAFSFVRLCKVLEPVLNDDASVMALS
ncbi:MAG TPA: SDR family oxidoreductase, partial [Fimbriimonadaceae bacterium]|nr:SDR family oxidoreductase [Fimbriimonadaceae bacterium]